MRLGFSIIAVLLIAILYYLTTVIWSNEDFEAEVYKSSGGNSLNYRIYMPENRDANKKYPLIVFFHGAGQRGTDNKDQLIYGVHDILAYSKDSNDPAIIIVPQSPKNNQWVNVPWNGDFTCNA